MTLNAKEMLMLETLKDELRYIRDKLDKHIEDQRMDFEKVHASIAEVREETRTHKTKFAAITGALVLIATGVITWITDHLRHS
jgi:hypothetical protein